MTTPYDRVSPVSCSSSWLCRMLVVSVVLKLTGAAIYALHTGLALSFILMELATLPLTFLVCWLALLAWRRRV